MCYSDSLTSICKGYYEKITALEGQKYDLEIEVARKDYEVRFDKKKETKPKILKKMELT